MLRCGVWQCRGADLTISPVHRAALGRVQGGGTRGLGMRFPRFVRGRGDKPVQQATSATQILELFHAQATQRGGGGRGSGGGSGGGSIADDEFL